MVQGLIMVHRIIGKPLPFLYRDIVVENLCRHPFIRIGKFILGNLLDKDTVLPIDKGLVIAICQTITPDFIRMKNLSVGKDTGRID